MRGYPISEREQAFILENAYKMTWGAIAAELSVRFKDDNGGERKWRGVQNWYNVQKQRRKEGMPKVLVPVESRVINLARNLGYTKNDLTNILEVRLMEILDTSVGVVAATEK